MSENLTVSEQAIVGKASQDLYRYERTCEEHSAVFSRDLEGCIKAHEKYTANSNPMSFMPPRDEFDRYIEESEKVLNKHCRTVLDHLHVVHAAYFLCRLLMKKVSEHGEHVYSEFIRKKLELDKQYLYVFPEYLPSDDYQYPNTLVSRPFESKGIMNLPRVSVQETELIQYQRRPELLLRETFVSFDEDEAEYQIFRIPAFITGDQERLFYLMYADEGSEALAWTSVHFFDLLRTSERVLNYNLKDLSILIH